MKRYYVFASNSNEKMKIFYTRFRIIAKLVYTIASAIYAAVSTNADEKVK